MRVQRWVLTFGLGVVGFGLCLGNAEGGYARRVKDIVTSPVGYGTSGGSVAVAVGTKAFTQGYSPATGYELWVTDGTAAGTKLVKDISPGTNS